MGLIILNMLLMDQHTQHLVEHKLKRGLYTEQMVDKLDYILQVTKEVVKLHFNQFNLTSLFKAYLQALDRQIQFLPRFQTFLKNIIFIIG